MNSEQLEFEFEIEEAAKKPGSYLAALKDAFHAGIDVGTAYADGYIDEEETAFEVWYMKKFLGGIS